MSRRRVAHARGPPLRPHVSYGGGPIRRIVDLLLPMRDRSFVAPVENFRHDDLVRAGCHETAHGPFVLPERSCPEDELNLSPDVGAQAARTAACLSHTCQRAEQELRQITNRAHPKTSYRYKGHCKVPTVQFSGCSLRADPSASVSTAHRHLEQRSKIISIWKGCSDAMVKTQERCPAFSFLRVHEEDRQSLTLWPMSPRTFQRFMPPSCIESSTHKIKLTLWFESSSSRQPDAFRNREERREAGGLN